MQCRESFGSVGTSGKVVHVVLSPVDCVGIFAKTALVAYILWTYIMWWIRAIEIMGVVVGAMGRGIGSRRCISTTITAIATRGLASVVIRVIFLGWIGIIMALEEIFEVFQGLGIKIMITMVNIIIDMLLRE